MNRRQVLLVAGSFSALVLLYCLSFGPIVYLAVKADRHGPMPSWIGQVFYVVFYPHLWVMYHCEPYFEYTAWFAEMGGEMRSTWKWQEFRNTFDD